MAILSPDYFSPNSNAKPHSKLYCYVQTIFPSPILYLGMYRYWLDHEQDRLYCFRLTFLARLVQHRYFSCRLRQLIQEMPGWPRPEQMNVQQSNVLPMLVHVVHGLLQCLAGRAHADGNTIGGRRAMVVEQLVFTASHFAYFIQSLLHDLRSLWATNNFTCPDRKKSLNQ